jgi:hypothetical protein
VTEQAPGGKDPEREEALGAAEVVVKRAVVVRWGAAASARAENVYAPAAATGCPIGQVLPVTRFDVLNAGR